MSESIELAELEERRDLALAGLDQLEEEFAKLKEVSNTQLSGNEVIAIVSKLARPQLPKILERVVSRSCLENGEFLSWVNFNKPGCYFHTSLNALDVVLKGYGHHCKEVFAKKVAEMPSGHERAHEVYADIGRLRSITAMYDSPLNVQVNDWSDIVPHDHENGGYLTELDPVAAFNEELDNFLSVTHIWSGDVYSVTATLNIFRERVRLIQLLHTRIHSYP